MIRLFQSVRCRLGCASLSREVHNFDGTIRQNLYRYIEKERDKVSQQIKDRYAIASVPNRKKAKKVNMDALYGITENLAAMDWLCSKRAPVTTKLVKGKAKCLEKMSDIAIRTLGLSQVWWKLDHRMKNFYSRSVIRKKLKHVEPFNSKPGRLIYLKKQSREITEAMRKALLINNVAVTSLTVQSGKMQHMRVFRYGNDKDVRAQIVMSYDVLVEKKGGAQDVETLYVCMQRYLDSGNAWALYEVVHFKDAYPKSWQDINDKWPELKQMNYLKGQL